MQPLRKIWEELPKASKKNRMAKVECLLEQDMAKPLDLFGDFLLNYWMLKSNLWKSLFINLIFCFKLVITTMIRNPRKGKSFFAKDRRFSSCSDMFQHWRRKHFSALRDVPTFPGGPVLCYPETHFHCYHWVKICRIPKELDPHTPTNAADLMCFFSFDCLSRTCENPWRFDHLPVLLEIVPSEIGKSAFWPQLGFNELHEGRRFPTCWHCSDAVGRWPWQTLILWEGGDDLGFRGNFEMYISA